MWKYILGWGGVLGIFYVFIDQVVVMMSAGTEWGLSGVFLLAYISIPGNLIINGGSNAVDVTDPATIIANTVFYSVIGGIIGFLHGRLRRKI